MPDRLSQTETSGIPRELLSRYEDGGVWSCDWGYCPHDAEAFAWSDSDPAEEWLPICGTCAEGKFPEINDEPYPVDRVVWFGDIERALGYPS